MEILSLLLPAAPFQVSPSSRLRSHLSKSRCVRSGDCREGTQRGVTPGPGCVPAHTFPSRPTPLPLTRSLNYLEKKESGIQVRVCREVLNLCGESGQMRDDVGRMRFTAPHPGPSGFPTLPGRQSGIPRLPRGAEQSCGQDSPGEASSPAPLPAPEGEASGSPTLTSCLPRSDESPPPEVPGLGTPPLQGPRLPWPRASRPPKHLLPGVPPPPPPPRAHWARNSRRRWRLDKALIRRS